MADKELRRLKRRDLLQMLLAQCEETERLQEELKEKTEELEKLQEGYERLKNKLDIKDERLNQKDAKIMELKNSIEEMKLSRVIDLNEAGSIAEASLKLNGIFEAAQQAAEQYLMNVKRISGNASELTKEKINPDRMKEPECIEISEQMEVSEQLAVPDQRIVSGNFTISDRRTVRGQKIPYESGWKPIARRKKVHG